LDTKLEGVQVRRIQQERGAGRRRREREKEGVRRREGREGEQKPTPISITTRDESTGRFGTLSSRN
jgi:hypothetical protein